VNEWLVGKQSYGNHSVHTVARDSRLFTSMSRGITYMRLADKNRELATVKPN